MRFSKMALLTLVLVLACGGRASTGAGTGADSSRAIESRRVTVEVLNPGRQAGRARSATVRLRQLGLDVVYFGSLPDTALARRERNLIYVRRGDTTGVGRVIQALGETDVVDRADATRLVDLSIILGRQSAAGRDSLRTVRPPAGDAH